MSKVLEIKNLSKEYHTLKGEVLALQDISFDVEDKDFWEQKSYAFCIVFWKLVESHKNFIWLSPYFITILLYIYI